MFDLFPDFRADFPASLVTAKSAEYQCIGMLNWVIVGGIYAKSEQDEFRRAGRHAASD